IPSTLDGPFSPLAHEINQTGHQTLPSSAEPGVESQNIESQGAKARSVKAIDVKAKVYRNEQSVARSGRPEISSPRVTNPGDRDSLDRAALCLPPIAKSPKH
ncbi:MAG: hypothetical protein K8J08_12390, partial [Thermoanaerobaculia bacterium]|nr:hypothetical protein [Thermoanaerobaculia bacterium]